MEKKKLIKSAGVISAFTFLSRLLGLTRDVMMAGFFGTSLVMSAFVVAFTIPNLFRRLFGEGALSSAFIPVLVEAREKEGKVSAWQLVNKVLFLLITVLTLITAVALLIITILPVTNPKTVAVLGLLKIMMPYMIFICLAAASMGILNSFQHFAISAFAPCILNILWIGALVFVVPHFGSTPEEKIRAVAWTVLLAGFLQWTIQWPVLKHFGWQPRLPNIGTIWKDEKVRRILILMGPAAIGMAVLQLNVVVDRLLAIWISEQAPSALYFSERLIYFPLGIFATALGTVLLPTFSSHAARNEHEKIREGIATGLCHLLFIMMPAAVGLFVLAHPIVQMPLEWGKFDASSTWMTAVALQCYAPGLIVFSLAKIFVPAFYGMQDTKTPVKTGMWAVLINFILNVTFILTLPKPIKHAGIAFATVLSSVFNISALAFILQRRIGKLNWKRIGITATRAAIASLFMALIVWGVHKIIPNDDKIMQIVSVLVSIGAGGIAYLTASFILRTPELLDVTNTIIRKIRR